MLFNLFDALPNETLTQILNELSNVFIGYIRVSRKFHAISNLIKEEKISTDVRSPFIVYSSLDKSKMLWLSYEHMNKYTMKYIVKYLGIDPCLRKIVIEAAIECNDYDRLKLIIESGLTHWLGVVTDIIRSKEFNSAKMIEYVLQPSVSNASGDDILMFIPIWRSLSKSSGNQSAIEYFK